MLPHLAAWKRSGGEGGVRSLGLLEGGVCRYLEAYGVQEGESGEGVEGTKGEASGVQEGKGGAGGNGDSRFLGKNFVFDPRRHDPQVSSSLAAIGTCVACEAPWDDYDHGGGHQDFGETRCDKCRVLILVCATCKGLGGWRCGAGGKGCRDEVPRGEVGVLVDDEASVRARAAGGRGGGVRASNQTRAFMLDN